MRACPRLRQSVSDEVDGGALWHTTGTFPDHPQVRDLNEEEFGRDHSALRDSPVVGSVHAGPTTSSGSIR